MRPEERVAFAAEAAAYARSPAFAGALVRGLGEAGVGQLFVLLGQDPEGPDNPLAALLASALGAAVPGEGEHDGVAAVLSATYVRADDRYGPSDTAAAGMAAVLSAGIRPAGGGPRMATVAEWPVSCWYGSGSRHCRPDCRRPGRGGVTRATRPPWPSASWSGVVSPRPRPPCWATGGSGRLP